MKSSLATLTVLLAVVATRCTQQQPQNGMSSRCERSQPYTEVFRGCQVYSGALKTCIDTACVNKNLGYTGASDGQVDKDLSLDADNPQGQVKAQITYTCIKKVGTCY